MDENTLSFRDACCLLSLGQGQRVQEVLAQPEQALRYHPLEQAYLSAALACEQAQYAHDLAEQERDACWQQAAHLLLAHQEHLYEARVAGTPDYFSRPEGTLHRRRPWTRWILGNLARHQGYLAVEQYAQALSLLNERRMNVPWLRVQILTDQAATLLLLHADRTALTHYQMALDLIGGSRHEAQGAIYLGLCETYLRLGETPQAARAGRLALAHEGGQHNADLLCLLGRVEEQQGSREDAFAFYQDALTHAQGSQRITPWLALARLYQAQGAMPRAWNCCTLALLATQEAEAAGHPLSAPQRAQVYRTCGQTGLEEETPGVGQPPATVRWYIRALQTHPDAGMRRELANLLDDLLHQDLQVAQFAWWRAAYDLLTRQH